MLSIKKVITVIVLLTTAIMTSLIMVFALGKEELNDTVTINQIAPIESTLKSNKYTQIDNLELIDDNPYTNIDGHELLGQVGNYEMYYHPTFLSLRIRNVETNYVWGSNMSYDYLHEDHPNYNPNDIGAGRYENPDYDENRDKFVREDRSPVVITYYNLKVNNNIRNTEYFFEDLLSGQSNLTLLTNKVGFKAKMTMPISKIKFDIEVYLDENGLNVEIPFDSIVDNENFGISTITVYRYFGFTKDKYTPGYVFIPDGVGALINYNSDSIMPYSKKFYGPDYTLGETSTERPLTASVFGLVHGVNQQAVLGIVESGAANATLAYNPSNGVQTNFNNTQITFEYRTTYKQKLNASGTSVVEKIQADKNKFDIHLIYKFLENDKANYVGFANEYREYLIKKGYDFTPKNYQENISMHFDILAVENKSVWYGNQTFKMTNTNDVLQIIDYLKESNINNLDLTIHGWQKGGQSNTSPNYSNSDKLFGNINDLNNINNVNVFYNMNHNLASINGSGYSGRNVVQNMGSELVYLDEEYLIKIEDAYQLLSKDYSSMSKKGVKNIGLSFISNALYSNYSSGLYSRSQYINDVRKYLEISEKTIVSQPFDYLWDAYAITDVSLYSSEQLKFTDTVPFVPIVLSGYKNVYGRSSNFYANTSNELLRAIDYNVYPNFYITDESAQLLLKTSSNMIFTSKFEDWKEQIVSQYNYVNNALKYVSSSNLLMRNVIHNGVVKNTYISHDKTTTTYIYVNYSGNTYIVDGITIKPMSYEVVV